MNADNLKLIALLKNFNHDQVSRRTVPLTFGGGLGFVADNNTKVQPYGPQTDHTSGEPFGFYFWFAKSTETIARAYETQLIINDLPPTGLRPQCLKFWYQINMPTVSSLYIYVKPVTTTTYTDPKWIVPYTHFDHWTRGQLTISAAYKHKIVFSLNMPRMTIPSQFIALDDISLSPGVCEAQISCDFEFDMCAWSNVRTMQANWNWVKFRGKKILLDKIENPIFQFLISRSSRSQHSMVWTTI